MTVVTVAVVSVIVTVVGMVVFDNLRSARRQCRDRSLRHHVIVRLIVIVIM